MGRFFSRPLLLVLFSALLAALVTTTVSKSESAPDLGKLKAKRDQLSQEIAKLNADPHDLKCKKDTDCDFLELGSKPCGGPREYLAYSKRHGKLSALKRKVGELTSIEKQINALEQLMSDCMVQLPPGIKCVNKSCVKTDDHVH